jgi:sphingomyelin phosphodiesterase acid-like 3
MNQAGGSAWTPAAAAEFAHGGYYSVTMAAPMQHTRLIVVNDIFLAPKYSTCANKPDEAAGARQIKWLKKQLNEARLQHQTVWVMGHIPPGVNPYVTANRGLLTVCVPTDAPDSGPAMFLANESLGDTLAKNGDIIQLAIFAHTHADEMRLFGTGDKAVAVKFVPSITPYNGNNPAFTVAQVDPATAVMADYTVFAATDARGSSWAKEYTFSEAYGHTGFTPATLRALMDGFRADTEDEAPASQAYLRYYSGLNAPVHVPGIVWQAGLCALTNEHAAEFTRCACALGLDTVSITH